MTRRMFGAIAGGIALTTVGTRAQQQATPGASPVAADWAEVVAETRLGSLRGRDYRDYAQFLGIPYAAPPVGDLRYHVCLARSDRFARFFTNEVE